MKYACQYAIVRFLPFAETGEFANVGIVLTCPQTGYFDFKLLNRVRRVSEFFKELDVRVFKNVRESLTDELARLRAAFLDASTPGRQDAQNRALTKHLFAELVRPREAIVRFGEMRVVLADDPAEKLVALYDHYIGRNFATKQYQENLLEKHVRQVLRQADMMGMYRAQVLENDAYHVRFPFVKMLEGQPTRIIKPLCLAQENPTKIFDHGWEWVGKIRKLKKEKLLPDAVLFAVDRPKAHDAERDAAFKEIVAELKNGGVAVVDYTATREILEFAGEVA
jgi:hypothetical protein